MQTKNLANIFLAISLIAYNFFFWKEKFGINLLIFTFVLTGMLYVLYPQSFRSSRKVWIATICTLITGIAVVILNTGLSKFTHIFSFIILAGFVHEHKLKTVTSSILNIGSNYIKAPLIITTESWRNSLEKHSNLRRNWQTLRLSLIPLIAFIIFYSIYASANPVFNEWSGTFWNKIGDFLAALFSFSRFFFLLLGFVLLGGIIYKRNNQKILNLDLAQEDDLIRKSKSNTKRKTKFPGRIFSILALKNEYKMGIIMLVLVNSLLLIINYIDVKWIWFNFRVPANFSLKEFVHHGTELLILSILLSMGILLYFFRRNLNFYKQNTLLKNLAYLWIFQNLILCISVVLRNYHYIQFHGLAYKRIGVYVFLLLTLIGLVLLFFKIKKLKTFFYLWRYNTWAAYFILIGLSLFSWDRIIAKYNLNHWNAGEIDVDYYLTLSDNALPIIYDNLPKVEQQIEKHKGNTVIWIYNTDFEKFKTSLENRKNNYLKEQIKYSFLSYNLADAKTIESLKSK